MPKSSDPLVNQHDYILEALQAVILLTEGDGARGTFYREVFKKAVAAALEEPMHVSDRDRMRDLFDQAVAAT